MVFAHDRPGVLNKISMLIRHKMYNVETLTVSATRQIGYSRITLTLYEDDDRKTRQVINQIEKMTSHSKTKKLSVISKNNQPKSSTYFPEIEDVLKANIRLKDVEERTPLLNNANLSEE